jgi:hypothetical protein
MPGNRLRVDGPRSVLTDNGANSGRSSSIDLRDERKTREDAS